MGKRGQAPAEATTPAQVADEGRRVALLVVVLGGIFIACMKALGSYDVDGFWRVRTGRYLLDERHLPDTDPFSWSAAGRSWRLNAWLFDLLDGALYRVGGLAATSLLTLACIVAVAVVLFLVAIRAGARPWPSSVVAMVSTYLISPFAVERPQSLSFVLFPLAIVLGRDALAGSNRALWQLGFLVAVWSNLHLTFAAAVVVIAVLAGCDVLMRRRVERAALVVAVSIGAGLCNPYGAGAYTASLNVRSESKAYGIFEWRPIDLSKLPYMLAVVMLGLAAVALFRTGRWRRLDVTVPIAIFAVLTIDARRNIPFLLALIGPELALGAPALRGGLERYARSRRDPLLGGLVIGMIALIATTALSTADLRPATRSQFPVRSTAAIPSGCRVLNEYRVGGYILHKRWPDVLVSQDGRNDMYGIDLLREQERVLEAKGDWEQWLDDNGVDCVLADPGRALVAELQARDWRTVEADISGVLLLRP